MIRSLYQKRITYSAHSTGRNWGYGSVLAVQSEDVVIDLSQLNKILMLDEEMGLVQIECGVTQGQLFEFLDSRGSRWMAPTTGAGPGGSVLSNVVEKGFGLNQISDHFSYLISIDAFLPDGTNYQSRLKDMGAHRSDLVSKWKIGPSIEGLFAQSNLGIVTSATIELAPRPLESFILILKAQHQQLDLLIEYLQEIRSRFGGLLGGINISNKSRISSTLGNQKETEGLQRLLEKAAGLDLPDYMTIVSLSIRDLSQTACIHKMRALAKKVGLKSMVRSESDLLRLRRLIDAVGLSPLRNMRSKLDDALNLLKPIKGEPHSFVLKLVYQENKVEMKTGNPVLDGVGLFWLSPIIPLTRQDIGEANRLLNETLPRFGFKPLITFVNFDSKLSEATIPLYFGRASGESFENAKNCYEALLEVFLAKGYAPYRFPINFMKSAE